MTRKTQAGAKPNTRSRRWLRWCVRALLGLVMLLLLSWLGMRALMSAWVAPEPRLAVIPSIVHLTPEQRDGRVYLGRNWFGRREGLRVLYLTGTAFEMGYANGVLTRDLIHQQEATLIRLMHKVAPTAVMRFLLQFAVVYQNRHLHEFIPPDQRLEMLGLSRGCPDAHPELGPLYNRIISFHAAQDISYMMMHSSWAVGACTAFAAWDTRAVDGHLLTGRNFDWEADPVFDRERVVVLCEPAQGIPFVSLAWAGMVGCVSGLNRDGLSITVNGGPSRLPSEIAAPTCIVAREVLQHAGSLAEATNIIARSRVFVSAIFLVGSRKDGRFVVVEKTPELTTVRESVEAPWIACANHYLTPGLEPIPVNQEALVNDTSQPRYERAVELLGRASDSLNPRVCADILRDRWLPGDHFAGNGHRSTLNPLIATHAVIMDLTDGILWAAAPPHQLGKFIAFDSRDMNRELPEKTIPEDPILASGEYSRYTNAVRLLEFGWDELKVGRAGAAEFAARSASTNNPGSYLAAWLLAAALKEQGRREEALDAAHRALDGAPALGRERAQLRPLLESLGAQPMETPVPATHSRPRGRDSIP